MYAGRRISAECTSKVCERDLNDMKGHVIA